MHDKFCNRYGVSAKYDMVKCNCDEIAEIRADEQAKFAHWTNAAISEKREAEVRADERERIEDAVECLGGWYDGQEPLNPEAPPHLRIYRTWTDFDEVLAIIRNDEEALAVLRAERGKG